MRANMIRRAMPWLQWGFVLLAVAFIVLFLRSHWQQLRTYPWQILPAWLTAATVLLALTWYVEVEIWRSILHQMGGQLPRAEALRMWFLSAIVRYIPGNIWQTVSLALYGRRWHIRAETTIASLVVYQVVVIIATIPIAVAYILFGSQLPFSHNLNTQLPTLASIAITVASVLIVVLLMSHGRLMFNLVDWALTRMHRTPLEIDMQVGFLTNILLVAILDWLLWGSTFAVFAYALGVISPQQRVDLLPELVTSYPLAYIAGLLSFFTPSGLGVREGAFLLLLTPQLDAALVAAIAVAMRVWITVGELLAAGIAAVTGSVGPGMAVEQSTPAPATTVDNTADNNRPRRLP